MQLFSQWQHLVEFSAKQEMEVSSAHWYGINGMAKLIVREMGERHKERHRQILSWSLEVKPHLNGQKGKEKESEMHGDL